MSAVSPIHPAYAAQAGMLQPPPSILTPAGTPYYPGAGYPHSSVASMMGAQPAMGATPYYGPAPAVPPNMYAYPPPAAQPGCFDHPQGCCIGLLAGMCLVCCCEEICCC